MNKNILITGASRGIGREIALSLAKEGYNIIATCKTNFALLEDLKITIEDLGVKCYIFKCNAADYSEISNLYESLQSKKINIDILINNAGISYYGVLQDMTIEEWNEIITTNLSSVFFTCKKFIPFMISQKQGKIINISSVWGNHGASCEVAYSSTKGGLNAFTKSLAKELAPSNIQVNAIACGFIETDMNRNLNYNEKLDIIREIPASRAGTPKDVSELVLAIIKSGNYLTGQIIALDGGWL